MPNEGMACGGCVGSGLKSTPASTKRICLPQASEYLNIPELFERLQLLVQKMPGDLLSLPLQDGSGL